MHSEVVGLNRLCVVMEIRAWEITYLHSEAVVLNRLGILRLEHKK